MLSSSIVLLIHVAAAEETCSESDPEVCMLQLRGTASKTEMASRTEMETEMETETEMTFGGTHGLPEGYMGADWYQYWLHGRSGWCESIGVTSCGAEGCAGKCQEAGKQSNRCSDSVAGDETDYVCKCAALDAPLDSRGVPMGGTILCSDKLPKPDWKAQNEAQKPTLVALGWNVDDCAPSRFEPAHVYTTLDKKGPRGTEISVTLSGDRLYLEGGEECKGPGRTNCAVAEGDYSEEMLKRRCDMVEGCQGFYIPSPDSRMRRLRVVKFYTMKHQGRNLEAYSPYSPADCDLYEQAYGIPPSAIPPCGGKMFLRTNEVDTAATPAPAPLPNSTQATR